MAYGWQSDTEFGTTPLWQANLTTGATLKTAQYNYLHTDHLGTVQLATDSTGQVTWKGNSEAFGKTILNPTNKITMNLRFPGQYYDQETGTHYNYFRDYDPSLGRYNESDPIGLRGGWNTFGYVEGNPIRWSDLFGLYTEIIIHDTYPGDGKSLGHASSNVNGTLNSWGPWNSFMDREKYPTPEEYINSDRQYRPSEGFVLDLTPDQEEIFQNCLDSKIDENYSTFLKNCSQVQGSCLVEATGNWGGLRDNTPGILKRNLLNGNYGKIKYIISYPKK